MREVRCENRNVPAGKLGEVLTQCHRDRVRLLPGRRCTRPDPQRPLRRARGDQLRKHNLSQRVEGVLVAEERRFVGCHRLDDRSREYRFTTLEPFDQRADTGEPVLLRDREKPRLDEVLLAWFQHDRGVLANERAEVVEVRRRERRRSHDDAPRSALAGARPRKRRITISSATRPSGISLDAIPACTTAPGIPHTTLVASSCAITSPPASTIACAPAHPSEPMPVRTTPSVRAPYAAATERNNGSAEGRHEFS